MNIVDSQLHMGRGKIEPTLEAMDALGIQSVVIDEFWGTWDSPNPTHIQPGYALSNGSWRAACPTAEEASIRYPDRFCYLVRIDRNDPQIESVMRVVSATPHARAFRLQPAWTVEEAVFFAAGGYAPLFEIVQELGRPVFLFIPGFVENLVPYLQRFPTVTFIVDHCGMGFPNIPPNRTAEEAQRSQNGNYFDEVLKLADYPNVALKWSHAQDRFGAHEYPYQPVRALLRRAIRAFGADRLMWASDNTVIRGKTWSELLHYLRDDPDLSPQEKAWILGDAARRILRW